MKKRIKSKIFLKDLPCPFFLGSGKWETNDRTSPVTDSDSCYRLLSRLRLKWHLKLFGHTGCDTEGSWFFDDEKNLLDLRRLNNHHEQTISSSYGYKRAGFSARKIAGGNGKPPAITCRMYIFRQVIILSLVSLCQSSSAKETT